MPLRDRQGPYGGQGQLTGRRLGPCPTTGWKWTPGTEPPPGGYGGPDDWRWTEPPPPGGLGLDSVFDGLDCALGVDEEAPVADAPREALAVLAVLGLVYALLG